MANPFAPAQIDFSMLAKLPELFWQGQDRARQNSLRGINAFNPDGTANLQAIWQRDPETAIKLLGAQSLAGYRSGMLGTSQQNAVPDDIQLLTWAQKNGYIPQPGPSRLGPSDPIAAGVDQADAEAAGTATPSGVPGVSIQPGSNMPSVLANKLLSPQELERQKKLGELGAQREGSRQGLKEAAPAAQSILNEFANIVTQADPDTFQNALGPWQGTAPDPNSWKDAISSAGAQTLGSVANYLDQGMKNGFVDWKTGNIKSPEEVGGGFTSTLRDKVKATQANLINLLQRVQRVVGIGSQSDKELQQIVDQVGNLGAARTQADFYDRLGTVVAGLKAQGIPVEIPKGMEPVPGKTTERYVNPDEGPMQGAMAPAPIKVPTYNVSPNGDISPTSDQMNVPEVPGAINGPVRQGPGAAPPTPPSRALNALKAYRNNPQARAAFDEIYGPGAAEFYLTKGR